LSLSHVAPLLANQLRQVGQRQIYTKNYIRPAHSELREITSVLSFEDRSAEVVVEQVGRQRSLYLVAIDVFEHNLLFLLLLSVFTLSVLLAGLAVLHLFGLSFFWVESSLLLGSLNLVFSTGSVFLFKFVYASHSSR